MNWFERHLNWTALVIAAGSIIVFEALLRVSLGFNNIYFEYFLRLGSPRIIWFGILIFTCFTLSAIGYSWVLHHKKRSLKFLTFYLIIAFFIMAHLCLQSMIAPEDEYRNTTLAFIGLEVVITYIVGWIVLLLLNNQYASGIGFLYKFFNSGVWLKSIIYVATGIAIIITIFSFFFTRYGHLTYQLSERDIDGIRPISFEYPPIYFQPLEYGFLVYPTYLRILFYNAFVNGEYTEISITFYDYASTRNIHAKPGYVKDWIVETMHFCSEIIETSIMLDGIPAHQLFCPSKGGLGSEACVFFEYKGCLWIIRWESHDEGTNNPPPYFTHLLESFKIYD